MNIDLSKYKTTPELEKKIAESGREKEYHIRTLKAIRDSIELILAGKFDEGVRLFTDEMDAINAELDGETN